MAALASVDDYKARSASPRTRPAPVCCFRTHPT